MPQKHRSLSQTDEHKYTDAQTIKTQKLYRRKPAYNAIKPFQSI